MRLVQRAKNATHATHVIQAHNRRRSLRVALASLLPWRPKKFCKKILPMLRAADADCGGLKKRQAEKQMNHTGRWEITLLRNERVLRCRTTPDTYQAIVDHDGYDEVVDSVSVVAVGVVEAILATAS
jgi:hypothetical protein